MIPLPGSTFSVELWSATTLPWSAFGSGHGGRVYPASCSTIWSASLWSATSLWATGLWATGLWSTGLWATSLWAASLWATGLWAASLWTASLCAANATSTISATLWSSRSSLSSASWTNFRREPLYTQKLAYTNVPRTVQQSATQQLEAGQMVWQVELVVIFLEANDCNIL